MTKTKIAKEIGIWLVTLLLVEWFVAAGYGKFSPTGAWATMFRSAHFSDWFRIVIGVVEIAAAAVLLVPRTAAYGAGSIIVVMIGALGTVLIEHPHGFNLIAPTVALILATIVLLSRWRQRAWGRGRGRASV